MSDNSAVPRKAQLLQVAVWGQAVGFAAMTAFLMYEDAPNILERADILLPLLLILGAIVLSIPKVISFIAELLPNLFLITMILIVSFSTILAAFAGVSLAFSIPAELVTEGWQYTRTTSLISLAIFLVAFIANLVLSIRLQWPSRAQESSAESL